MTECLKSEAGKQSSFVPANVFDTVHPERMAPSMLLFAYRHSRPTPSIVAKNSFRNCVPIRNWRFVVAMSFQIDRKTRNVSDFLALAQLQLFEVRVKTTL